ncbi:helix-turn-helix domain-containing protein [Enterobacteriaceae bacterium H20N1]|uniref:Arabinose operon regulatory protein n=1 Tax=Dryocola boscaweniae TaxID=2925397 RepID=A0A9X3AAX0_9ENTR|nr:helix-turn-helix domain-containing protein [Dryocola boscaweniae]MCT4701899.1 helix-turn-helix domain-containing protein [Dryocola boscaweniae]MCT4719067.1 helix-turn-helix domain-containing protein [Dryocola boscaweniae]
MSLNNIVPVFKLYGESLNWPTPELLHCESIHSRSSLYEWNIRVHQHADLVQLLYMHKGQAEIEIEGTRRRVNQACLQIVPALCIHGFRFAPGTQGYSLSFAAPLIAQFEEQFGRPLQVLMQAACVPVKASRGQINTLFHTLQNEYEGDGEARDMMIHSLISALLVWLNRQCKPALIGRDKVERRRCVIRRFNKLVESHYREHLSIAHYASLIGLSSVHLNTLCHEFYGHSALGVLHQRLMLEAKRSLLYTSMTISQISDYLGFSDATYFSRFFRRHTGATPKAFRIAPVWDSVPDKKLIR